ncbi:MAG: branched-chain amino acid ABC transporter substrate-binding protein [Chloroflexi bacterium]|jgi:branched-chain amino acid transport system substrate-binding protein|nr:branched-chain amino acid ABC transporter substrate-binding protein [Chloroflexota bacterium]
MKLTRLGAALAAASIVVAACGGTGGDEAKTLKIGITLPLSGSSLASAGPARDGALLAIKEANAAGTIKGYTLVADIKDHAVNGVHDPQQGAKDMTALASDAAVVGVVGPFNSSVAKVQIPISNENGLFQCSPANTNPDLTKGDPGKELRPKDPVINYVRVAATDDIQGPAVATYGIETLGLKKVAIIDDTETYGKGLADAFQAEWEKLGGEVVGREGAPKGTTDYLPVLTKFKESSPDAVFYGGVTATGGGLVRKQMPQAGLGDLVYLGGDGIQDGRGDTDGSFINIAGEAAANSFSSVAAIAEYPGKDEFAKKYEAEYKVAPGAYSASGYACAQVVIKAIEAAAAKGDVTRENVRAAGTDPSTTFETVLGAITFDAVGDTNQRIISLYKADLAAGDGTGDWVFAEQVNYGN